MKYRSDYVTNSSSSSFVVAFKPGEDVEQTIRKNYDGDLVPRIVNDVNAAMKQASDPSAFSTFGITDFLLDDAWYDAYSELNDQMGYGEAAKWRETYPEEFELMVQNRVNALKEELQKRLVKADRIAVVEYEDDSLEGSQLEHEIMPSLSCTIQRFSHH